MDPDQVMPQVLVKTILILGIVLWIVLFDAVGLRWMITPLAAFIFLIFVAYRVRFLRSI